MRCNKLKKLILIFGVFAIVCVIISASLESSAQTQLQEEQIAETTATTASTYIIKSENGRIVVYENDELLYKTTTAVSTLPKKDQKTLLYGISANTKEEVKLILQQFCS